MKNKNIGLMTVILSAAILLSGCKSLNNAAKGGLIGSGAGAAIGAGVGVLIGKSGKSATILATLMQPK